MSRKYTQVKVLLPKIQALVEAVRCQQEIAEEFTPQGIFCKG